MGKIRIFSLMASLLVMQMLVAQNPAISTRYSNSEVARMIEQFRLANSHDTFPPSSLQQKFRADFPNARDVEWETGGGIFEVEFKIRSRDFKAFYDRDGNLLMVMEEIRSFGLPAIVRNAAETRHPKFRFDDVAKIRRGTETIYKVEMKRAGVEVKMLIRSDGTILEERFDY